MGKPFNLKNGSVALSAEVPGGLYNSAHLKKLAALSEQHSVIMKATEDQRMALFVAPDQVESIAKELASGGLTVRDYQDGIHQPVSCIGALCAESKQDALKSSLDLTEALAGLEASCALKIGINGCAACCVPCHTLDIAITGSGDGYRISLGGKQAIFPELATFAAEGVPADELVGKVRAVVETWQQVGQPGERMSHVVERVGLAPFMKALAPYSQDASDVADENLDAPSAMETGMESVVESTPGPVDAHAEVMDSPGDFAGDTSGDISSDSPGEGSLESTLESSMMASMEAEAAIPVVTDENASAREEVLEGIPGVGDLPPPEAEAPVDAMESAVHEEPVLVADEAMEVENVPGDEVIDPVVNDSGDQRLEDNVISISGAGLTTEGHEMSEGVGMPNQAVANLESMEIDASGKFVFTFAGGASITVDPTVIPFGGSRKLKFAGKEILVGADAKGFNIAVDGLTFHMPLEAA
jgi:hypothetical protein